MSIDICGESQTTVCELSNRLVHVDGDSRAQAPGLSYPNISLSPQVSEQDEHEHVRQLPVLIRGTGDGACWIRADEDVAQPSLVNRVSQQVASKLWPLAWPLMVTRKWLMGYGFELVPGASKLPSAMTAGNVPLPPASMPPPLAWHPHRSMLASADTRNRVLIHDMASVEQGLGGGALRNGKRADLAPSSAAALPHARTSALEQALNGSTVLRAGPGEAVVPSEPSSQPAQPAQAPPPLFVLAHPAQPQVHSLAWRPNNGACLAVGARGVVCLWELSGGGPASLRPPVSARSATAPSHARSDKGPGPWLSVLRVADSCARLSALAWSPDGRLLAAASPDMPGVTLWDAASGEPSVVGVGLAAIAMLRWSPCGTYLFGAGVGPRFHVWETSSWTSASWDVPLDAGPVAAAAWAPTTAHTPDPSADVAAGQPQQRRVLLLSFEHATRGGGHLVALHFVDKPPSLNAMLMPVVLQDIAHPGTDHPSGSEPGAGAAEGASRSVISDWAWDPSGERLAVLMAPPHPLAGCLALYATSVDPVVHARLIGFARPPLDVGRSVSQGPPASQGPSRIQGQAGRQGPVRGRVAAHCKFARGALFSVRLGGGESCMYNLPMYYK
mmetsp:Transcript_25425/g.69069  ORF Transcript_25425/g.69069 Transcript_25425/m.69069 type:complete len:613 (-) Transcript_25425:221-2059(-)